jgi:hypothetical protein
MKTKNSLIRIILFLVFISSWQSSTIYAQSCSGAWVTNRPLTFQCLAGQLIGYNNSYSDPIGCPTNPTYTSSQTNTFNFSNPVNDFYIDFNGFGTTPGCARIQIKINNIFYHLTSANLVNLPSLGTFCTGNYLSLEITPDGFITGSPTSSNSGVNGEGRLIFQNVNATSISISTNDGFSGSVFANPCAAVLPVKLLFFNGNNNNCVTILKWKTAFEQNLKSFEILKSNDGVVFTKVGEVEPKGSGSSYSFEFAQTSDAFFRLKTVDLDSSFSLSDIIHVKSFCDENITRIFPNPAKEWIDVSGLKNESTILISDALGRNVLTFKKQLYQTKINIQHLPKGIYFIRTNDKNFVGIKLIKY